MGPYDQMRNLAFSFSSMMKHVSLLVHKIYQTAQGNEMMSDIGERKHQNALANHFHKTRHSEINKLQ